MADLRIVENYPEWDSFVSTQPYASPFAHTDFLELVVSAYGGKVLTLSVLKGDRIITGVAVRTVGRHVRAAAPMTYMPVLYTEIRSKTFLQAQLTLSEHLRRRFSVIHYLSATPFYPDMRGFQRQGFGAQVLYTALTHLSEFDIMAVEQKQRNIVYKGQKEGIQVKITQDLNTLWPIYKATFQRKTLETAYSQEFFVGLSQLRDRVRTYVAEKDGNILGFASILLHNKVAYYYVSGNTPEGLKLGASPFLMFSILSHLKEQGFEYFDWCGINLPSLAGFKLSFGSNATPYFAIYYEPKWLRILKAR